MIAIRGTGEFISKEYHYSPFEGGRGVDDGKGHREKVKG
jgi:hypothetical protein